ncbi:translation factor GTPase family protein [uncultured Faecalibacterium sp.]|jgi:small GTP-binding protein|uniref:translation factor GTPase family protein n=1 Tax=uncultured Faecalibacterium sp. TaxID=259315 RepID=UPI0026DB9DAB|nr:TetM/TetW/TetO/TetS family tetracycline resistance ribosomal protection protein [uncultured Faecalibacterium sp.]
MESTRKQIVLGILAHVDSGKTTLSEAMLYRAGVTRRLGRVDHKDAFLDTDALEKERGITIFSKQALLTAGDTDITLLDTPGHVDFSTETERTLQVLDYAVLVVSGTDGVQSHTETLWRLLRRYHVPTFVFVNKMDLPGMERQELLAQLNRRLGEGFVDFGAEQADRDEALALCDENLMDRMLDAGQLQDADLIPAIARRHVFPCWFGAALKLEGVDALLDGLDRYTRPAPALEAFGAKVFKVSQDEQGARLTWLRVTGGELKVKAQLTGEADGEPWAEKANQLRLYSGAKYTLAEAIGPGQVCAVTGLTKARPGEGLGAERDSDLPVLEPVLSYQVLLPEGADVHAALGKLHRLEEEEPQLHVVWNETLGEIHVQLMGEIQLEVLRSLLAERFGLEVEFGPGGILYKETITEPMEGVGHYEPLRHYAEVHLKLEPLPRGSGMQFAADCREEVLDKNWQRLVLTHLEEKQHLGVLTGSPLTDVKITLIAGRAHLKHTEGGDFRQATYRAVRQGLMLAKSQLLEPWYAFRLEVPAENIGRAMSDIQRMEGTFDPPESGEETAVLTGFAPVSTMRSYPMEVVSYTRGRGHLSLTLDGYRPCHNAQEVIAAIGYEPEHDLDNPADSVFCAHGAGFVVPWDQVRSHMHVDSGWGKSTRPEQEAAVPQRRAMAYRATLEEDAELLKIFERTYGPIKRDPLAAFRPVQKRERPDFAAEQWEIAPEYLLVDGYNIIFAWDELNALSKESLDAARHKLMDILCNYQGFQKCVLILVFDAYRVPGSPGSIEQYHNIHVVYTKEAETADMFIERVTHEIGRNRRVRVATSDGMEQIIILGHGALRVSARMFHEEVQNVEKQIRALVQGEA